MIKLDQRHDAKERMDDMHIDLPTVRETYRQINNLNVCTLGYWPTMKAVKYFIKRHGRRMEIRILDIGCGDGETLRRIARYGREHHISLRLTGIDVNPAAIDAALAATVNEEDQSIEYICADALTHSFDKTYDLIINSLTMHHLSCQQIVSFIRWMTRHAAAGWFISDLHRHALAYHFIKCFVRMGRFNPVVRHDAPLSVARGFQRREWEDLLDQAGLYPDYVDILWYPNFRYGIRYERPV